SGSEHSRKCWPHYPCTASSRSLPGRVTMASFSSWEQHNLRKFVGGCEEKVLEETWRYLGPLVRDPVSPVTRERSMRQAARPIVARQSVQSHHPICHIRPQGTGFLISHGIMALDHLR